MPSVSIVPKYYLISCRRVFPVREIRTGKDGSGPATVGYLQITKQYAETVFRRQVKSIINTTSQIDEYGLIRKTEGQIVPRDIWPLLFLEPCFVVNKAKEKCGKNTICCT